MAEQQAELGRLCPTRTDGIHPLIAQRIAPPTCLQRQRQNYHKCFSCGYRGLAAVARLPEPFGPAAAPEIVAPGGQISGAV